MKGGAYMKGQEIISHVSRQKMPDKERVRENCLNQNLVEKRNYFYKPMFIVAFTAVIVVCVLFANILINPKSGNTFTLKVYAMSQLDDGSIELSAAYSSDEQPLWGIFNGGTIYFLTADLKCEGENIRAVTYYAEDCFFSKINVEERKAENEKFTVIVSRTSSPNDISGEADTHIIWHSGFGLQANVIKLSKNDLADDFLLLVGIFADDENGIPPQITVRAVVVFDDGETQEQTLTLNLK